MQRMQHGCSICNVNDIIPGTPVADEAEKAQAAFQMHVVRTEKFEHFNQHFNRKKLCQGFLEEQ